MSDDEERESELVFDHIFHTNDFIPHFAVPWCWCRPERSRIDPLVYIHRFVRGYLHS